MTDVTEASDSWAVRLAPFKKANNERAGFELALTLLLFCTVWVVIHQLITHGWMLVSLPLFVLAAGLMVRLFIIQHDCGHGSMFTSVKVNSWVGRILGILTMTPYEYWRRMHATHHAGSGNLQRRGIGDIDTLTVDEYLQSSTLERLRYRLYRNPFIMFVIGPAYLFLLRHRLPVGAMTQGSKPWISTFATNTGIVALSALMMYFVGWKLFLAIQIPIVIIGGAIGIWMFYVQHQFDGTHWEEKENWKHEEGALHGSSFYDLPKPLMWLTGNIGIHHVHHLSSRIPFHTLPAVLEAYPELKSIGRVTPRESLKCISLALWDVRTRKLVSFSDVSGLSPAT